MMGLVYSACSRPLSNSHVQYQYEIIDRCIVQNNVLYIYEQNGMMQKGIVVALNHTSMFELMVRKRVLNYI